jgi:DNA mismatch repair ATPase MutS
LQEITLSIQTTRTMQTMTSRVSGREMSRDVRKVEAELERMREIRDALAEELQTAAGQGRVDREAAYRRACEACRRLVEAVERGYGAV